MDTAFKPGQRVRLKPEWQQIYFSVPQQKYEAELLRWLPRTREWACRFFEDTSGDPRPVAVQLDHIELAETETETEA